MKDRSVRGIMMVSPLNFALKSQEEQEATIFQFQSFLNSLDFSSQIIIQSRRVNLTGYLEMLGNLAAKQVNELLKEQTADYRRFVEGLIGGGSIMTKNFFIVMPFTLLETKILSREQSVFSNVKIGGSLSNEEFSRMRVQLWQRMEFVALGLKRSGLQVIPLNTEELVELFWAWHHPKEAEVGYYPEIPPEILS